MFFSKPHIKKLQICKIRTLFSDIFDLENMVSCNCKMSVIFKNELIQQHIYISVLSSHKVKYQ